MAKIELELSELQELLNWQRHSCAEYMTRNLSVYHWYNSELNLDTAKHELQSEARKAPYPNDFLILSKYIK